MYRVCSIYVYVPCTCMYHVCSIYVYVPYMCMYHICVCTMYHVPCVCTMYHICICTMYVPYTCMYHVCSEQSSYLHNIRTFSTYLPIRLRLLYETQQNKNVFVRISSKRSTKYCKNLDLAIL